MYDATNEPREFIGEGRAEAVGMACEFFGAEEEALVITELKPGEVYGLANRAVVVAVPRDRRPPARERTRGDAPARRGRERNERPERRDRGEHRDRGERPRRSAPRAEPAEEPTEPSVGTMSDTVGDVGAFVCGVIERMDLGPFEIGESGEGGLLVLEVRGPAAPGLAGSDGRAVDALQLLANQAAGRLSEEPPRVVLDVEGDADARESRLTKLAQRVARRARESGRVVRLDPMNGRDRRIIHLALRDEEDVATMSTGQGRYRQVVVVPEGAAEFEEAQRESEAAAERSGT